MSNEKVKFLLNWNHFSEHLSSCMTKLMTDSSYSDIIIATADKRMIYSHRFVLANSSKYFQRLLKHVNRQHGLQLVVALPEIKYEIFKILMNYMYKGETQVPHELLPSVIKAGQLLEIIGLVNLNENDGSGESCKHSSKDSKTSNGGYDGKHFKRIPSTLRDNIQSRENNLKNSHVEKTKSSRAVASDDVPKSPIAEEKGKENRNKVTRSIKCKTLPREKNIIQLPLKRKAFIKETEEKTSPTSSPVPSISSESIPSKKQLKSSSKSPDSFTIKIKEEKEDSRSSVSENDSLKITGTEEKITIKMEIPDDIEEVEYNELQCEFCHEIYTNPSDWVKHMTEQHSDRGYQAYNKDLDKSVGGNAVITCVVCSSVCFSASEWAKHLRLWHTEHELTLANLSESSQFSNKMKKKTGHQKKE